MALPGIREAGSRHSCFQAVRESKWTDLVLVVGFVALLIIGILASAGVMQFMGAAQAAYLSYGMYGGAALLLAAEVFKIIFNCCNKTRASEENESDVDTIKDISNPIEIKPIAFDPTKDIDDQIQDIIFSDRWEEGVPPHGSCRITFANDQAAMGDIDGLEAKVLIDAVSPGKCRYNTSTKGRRSPEDNFKIYTRPNGLGPNDTPQQIIQRVIQQHQNGVESRFF